MTRMSPTSLEWLAQLAAENADVELFGPCRPSDIASAEAVLGILPDALKALYNESNGLRCRSFQIYPIFQIGNEKRTWESIQRANDKTKAEAVGGDPDLLARFLVFADIGGGFGLFDRSDMSIWYQELSEGEMHRTTMDLKGFVERMVANAS